MRTSDGNFRVFDPDGSTGTFANNINGKEQVVGFFTDSEGNYHGFLRSR